MDVFILEIYCVVSTNPIHHALKLICSRCMQLELRLLLAAALPLGGYGAMLCTRAFVGAQFPHSWYIHSDMIQ